MSRHDHHHADNHADNHADADWFSQETWDERYSGPERVWSGNPNQRLVEQVGGLTPGEAIDVGAGEGADSVWLAKRGWKVTALDVSPVALRLTSEHAAENGVDVTTVQQDLLRREPLPGSYDLVSAHFWHPPLDAFEDFRDVLGAAVRPGGTLLVVGHHPHDASSGARDTHGHDDLMYTPDRVVALFRPEDWEVRVAQAQTRSNHREEGPDVVTDTVVVLTRR